MCGIAGFLTIHGNRADHEVLTLMCDRLTHRGPDGHGYYIAGGTALGHRRLSIIDVAGGSQPLGNEDGTVQVVFNGEIYNFQQIREDLLARGHQFKTRSDTEVLVHLYEEVGERLPEFLNGMFAFAIWDARNQELFLARDRMGKKPLYYTKAVPGLRFCFASELKALTAIPGYQPRLSRQAVAGFLAFSYVPEPGSIYEDVSRLGPGESMTVHLGGERIRRYWSPEFAAEPRMRDTDALDQLNEIAADAVGIRMVSDVPLGAFLSGGVDSSAVVAMMAESAPGRVKTFSIGFSNGEFDETRYARQIVERYQTEHYETTVSPSIEEMLGTLVRQYDEPFGDSSAIPTLYLARMTREGVTVALSGDGADEVFAGYRRYYYGVLEHRLRQMLPARLRRPVFSWLGRYYPKLDSLPQWLRAKTLLGNLAQDLPDAYFTSMTTFRDQTLHAILGPEFRSAVDPRGIRESYRRRFARYRHLDPLTQMQAVDMETYLPGDILVKVDRATMAYSLESRAPWLDYRLVDLAGQMPPHLKLNARTGKHIFKVAMAPRISNELTYRRKMGFSVPLAEWFRGGLREVFSRAVERPDMEEFVDLGEVRRLQREHESRLHDHGRKLWNLLMLACWDWFHRQGRPVEALLETGRAPRGAGETAAEASANRI